MSRWPAFMLFIGVAVWSELSGQFTTMVTNMVLAVTLLAQCDSNWFTARLFQTPGVVSGSWVTSGGTFNSTSTTTGAIATIDSYIPETVFHESLGRSPRAGFRARTPTHAQHPPPPLLPSSREPDPGPPPAMEPRPLAGLLGARPAPRHSAPHRLP